MRHCDEEFTEIEMKPDGSWRGKFRSESERRELGQLSRWHEPDGSLFPTVDEVKPKMEILAPIKQEGCSDPLKLGIRKNHNGSKPNNGLSSSNRQGKQYVIPMSSSASGSGDDSSVNQDAVRTFDFGNNGIELDSLSRNVDSGYNFSDRNHQPAAASNNSEVIVLTDSDEENDVVVTAEPHGLAVGKKGLGLFTNDDDDYDMRLWQLSSEAQGGPGFQLFASDAGVSEGLVGPQNCDPAIDSGYCTARDTSMPSIPMVPRSVGGTEADANDGLANNPLAFSRDGPSFQIFLPTRPETSAQSDFRNQAEMSKGIHSDDWISLRLGGANGLNPGSTREEGDLDTLSETASLLLGMNNSRQRSESPFSFPRQKRSVRPRLFLSIDSDSE